MRAVSVVAASALSALGRGALAYGVGELGAVPPCALALVPQVAAVRRPLFGCVPSSSVDFAEGDRAQGLLCAVAQDLVRALDRSRPAWRAERIGIVVGSSSGAMPTLERALAVRGRAEAIPPALARSANYFSPVTALVAELGVDASQTTVVQILAACASSTIALGLGCRWLDAGEYDLVIAGGYDALSALVAAGFDALSALTRTNPRPFRTGRDGMALGEGAGLVALRLAAASDGALGRVFGFGASSDAVHVTAPDREGRGLASAARAALADAALEATSVDWVSAHATATPYNDQAEARALLDLFEGRTVPVQPWKAVIGHTLGAAGVLEALAAWDALGRGVVPAAPGEGELDPDAQVTLEARNRAVPTQNVLKLSAAFGGCNAALLLGRGDAGRLGRVRARCDVALHAFGERVTEAEPELVAGSSRDPNGPASRADSLSELVLTAVARLLRGLAGPLPEATAVVVGSSSATLELDERFDLRRRAGEAVEPRRFPPTSPNLCAGLCSICFGWRGPSFSVGASLAAGREAVLVAHDLVAAGDAPAAVVVLAEDSGPVVRDLFGAAGFPVPARGARAALLAPGSGWPLSRRLLAVPAQAGGHDFGPLQGFFGESGPRWP